METAGGLVKTRGILAAGARLLGRAGGVLLDQLYPPLCLCCDKPVAVADALCAECFRKVRPITAPLCPVLGIPFEVALGPEAVSAQAIADPPPFERARSAVLYNEVARAIVSRMKYSDRPELARFCARLMASAGTAFWAERPILVPVPLHRVRQVSRRYNQSVELARALARLTDASVDTSLVGRMRATRQQVGLSADARQRNVAGAFVARAGAGARVGDRRVVIVDDVITTGSTVNAVTKALHKAGINKVDVISFARVVVGDDLPA